MEQVLIVDDDDDIRRLVGYHLEQAGFEVVQARTGNEGWYRLSKNLPIW